MDGHVPSLGNRPWACCFSTGECMMLPENVCNQSGGIEWHEGILCDPNPCAQPWACCFATELCLMLLEEDCMLAGGVRWIENRRCDPNPCEPIVGACCLLRGS